ncbi:dna methyltransferase, partial [Cystoisospora suis]
EKPATGIGRSVYANDQLPQPGHEQKREGKEQRRQGEYVKKHTLPTEEKCADPLTRREKEKVNLEVYEFFSGIGGLHAGWNRAVDIFNRTVAGNLRENSQQATAAPHLSAHERPSISADSSPQDKSCSPDERAFCFTGETSKQHNTWSYREVHAGQRSADDSTAAGSTCRSDVLCPRRGLGRERACLDDSTPNGSSGGALFSKDHMTMLEAPVCRAHDVNCTANAVYAHNFRLAPQAVSLEYLSASCLLKKKNLPDAGGKQMESADVWLLSPPCQPYTRGGKRLDVSDSRAAGLLHLLRLLQELDDAPRMLFLENVRGFENSESHRILMETLRVRGFQVEEFLVSPTQLGCPNTRVRYYCLAWQKGGEDRFWLTPRDPIQLGEEMRTERKHGAGGDTCSATNSIHAKQAEGKGKQLHQGHGEAIEWKQEDTRTSTPETGSQLHCSLPAEALRLWCKYSFAEADSLHGSTQADGVLQPPTRQIGDYLDAEMDEAEYRSLLVPPEKLSRFVRFADGSCTHACTVAKPPRDSTDRSEQVQAQISSCSYPGEVEPHEGSRRQAQDGASDGAPRKISTIDLHSVRAASGSWYEKKSDSTASEDKSIQIQNNHCASSPGGKNEKGDSVEETKTSSATETAAALREVSKPVAECGHAVPSTASGSSCSCCCCVASQCICGEVAFRLDIVTAASTASSTFTKGYGSNLHRGGPLLLIGSSADAGCPASSASGFVDYGGTRSALPLRQPGSSGGDSSRWTKPPCCRSPAAFTGSHSTWKASEDLCSPLPLSFASASNDNAHVFATESMDSSRFRHALKSTDVLRLFSPRELLRLHGYPPWFSFPKNVSMRKAISLVGNSVNVDVVSVLLLHMLLSYFGKVSKRSTQQEGH